MAQSSSWIHTEQDLDYSRPSRVARMILSSPRRSKILEVVPTCRRIESGASLLPVLSLKASQQTTSTIFTPSSSHFEDQYSNFEENSESNELLRSNTEQAQLMYMDQLYDTICCSDAELESKQRLETRDNERSLTYSTLTDYSSNKGLDQVSIDNCHELPTRLIVSETPVTSSHSPQKLRTMPSPPSYPAQSSHYRIARPSASSRVKSQDQDERLCATLGRNAELRICSKEMERVVEKLEQELALARKQIKTTESRAENRDEKLRALLQEKLKWQKDLKAVRAYAVDEKMRQVDLFREVELMKRHFAAEVETLEQQLRHVQEENAQLRSHAVDVKAQMKLQSRKLDEMKGLAQDEKAQFVLVLENTRQRFHEWKEREGATLEAAHDQVLRNLKTEYELKLERHHEEKQKLRDKVNELEALVRHLQKDRTRKTAIVSSKDNTGMVEVGHIETQSRILELERLLEYSREYQTRQENILKLSEATISRLMQERELKALENLSLHPFDVELQQSEDVSYDGRFIASTSRGNRTEALPWNSQDTVLSTSSPRTRPLKSRSHTPSRADLKASIAQTTSRSDVSSGCSVGMEGAAPSLKEQSLMDELARVRRQLAQAQSKRLEIPVRIATGQLMKAEERGSSSTDTSSQEKPLQNAQPPMICTNTMVDEVSKRGTESDAAIELRTEQGSDNMLETKDDRRTDKSLQDEIIDKEQHDEVVTEEDKMTEYKASKLSEKSDGYDDVNVLVDGTHEGASLGRPEQSSGGSTPCLVETGEGLVSHLLDMKDIGDIKSRTESLDLPNCRAHSSISDSKIQAAAVASWANEVHKSKGDEPSAPCEDLRVL